MTDDIVLHYGTVSWDSLSFRSHMYYYSVDFFLPSCSKKWEIITFDPFSFMSMSAGSAVAVDKLGQCYRYQVYFDSPMGIESV
jgi:hypothetical protein